MSGDGVGEIDDIHMYRTIAFKLMSFMLNYGIPNSKAFVIHFAVLLFWFTMEFGA